MERRAFLTGSVLALGASVAPSIAATPIAHAQHRAPCPTTRAEWSGTGAPDGRVPGDPSALSEEERAHVPVLTLPARVRAGRPFDLVVQIGVRPHEIRAEHRIDWIEIAIDERRVMVGDLSIDVAYPVLRVPIVMTASCVLTARARCTQHGVWMTRREITIA